MDALGSISYTAYDPATGAVVGQIQDANVNSNNSGQYSSAAWSLLPSSWQTSNAQPMNLITTYAVDPQGRTVKETDPDGDTTYTVYDDAAHEVRVYPGWHVVSSGTYQTTGPVQVYREDWSGSYTESLTYSFTGGWSGSYINNDGSPKGSESLTNSNVVIQSLSRSILDQSGQVISSLDYTSMPSSGYSESSAAFGTEGSNYLESDYTYDVMGRAESTINPAGTVSFTMYNGFGEATGQWAGTTTYTAPVNRAGTITTFRGWLKNTWNGTSTTYTGTDIELYMTSSSVYNADGEVTATTAYVNGNSAHNRVTSYGYDWQDQQTYVVNPADAADRVTYTMTTYDNLGEATWTQQYLYGGSESNGVPTTLAAATNEPPGLLHSGDLLLSQSSSLYDPLGQVYQTSIDQIDGNGNVISGKTQTTNNWYDPDGNEVATEDPAGNATIWAYNGLGQVTQSTQGQMIGGSSGWTFVNLAATATRRRTYEVYVHLTSAPSSGWQGDYSASDSSVSLTLTAASGAAPSAGGWYDLGTMTLAANDNSTSVSAQRQRRIQPGRGLPRLQRPILVLRRRPGRRRPA